MKTSPQLSDGLMQTNSSWRKARLSIFQTQLIFINTLTPILEIMESTLKTLTPLDTPLSNKRTAPNLTKNLGVFCKKKYHFPQECVLNHEIGRCAYARMCIKRTFSYRRTPQILLNSHMTVRIRYIRVHLMNTGLLKTLKSMLTLWRIHSHAQQGIMHDVRNVTA